MNIITKNLDEQCPVYHQYQIQNQPQPAYIELDCRGEGELMADYSGEIGNAVPMYYWHRLAVRWSIPAETTGESLRALFQNEEFLALCQQIIDGFEEVWDGSNYVGRYDEDADVAIERAAALIEQSLEQAEVWAVNDWLFSSCSLKEHWSDEPISEAVATLETCVESNQMLDGDLEEALIENAKSEFEYHPNQLTETHIAELLARDAITQEEADEWREEYGKEGHHDEN